MRRVPATRFRQARSQGFQGWRGSTSWRILMTTEGTYPHAVGGVSSWCDLVIGGLPEFDWQILPIMAGDRRVAAIFELPSHASLVGQIELWSDQLPRRRWLVASGPSGGKACPPTSCER